VKARLAKLSPSADWFILSGISEPSGKRNAKRLTLRLRSGWRCC
jgi:hypothetical protein